MNRDPDPSRDIAPEIRISSSSGSLTSFPIPGTNNKRRATEDPKFCLNLVTYETCINIVGIMGIVLAIGKISVISYYIPYIHKEYPVRSTYYLCGVGICFSAIMLIWEFPMLYFVHTRKLSGLQQFMFAMMLLFLGSCLGAVITGTVYKSPGLPLSLSFIADIVCVPAQMFFVHKVIKTNKLNEDTLNINIAAYYKKF